MRANISKKNEKINDLFILLSVLLTIGIIMLLTRFRLNEMHEITLYSEKDTLYFFELENKYNLLEEKTIVLEDENKKEYNFDIVERTTFLQTESGTVYKIVLNKGTSDVSPGRFYLTESNLLLNIVINR